VPSRGAIWVLVVRRRRLRLRPSRRGRARCWRSLSLREIRHALPDVRWEPLPLLQAKSHQERPAGFDFVFRQGPKWKAPRIARKSLFEPRAHCRVPVRERPCFDPRMNSRSAPLLNRSFDLGMDSLQDPFRGDAVLPEPTPESLNERERIRTANGHHLLRPSLRHCQPLPHLVSPSSNGPNHAAQKQPSVHRRARREKARGP
jgi:hypothetical protein